MQRKLLQYRLKSLNHVSLSPTPGDDKLISRNRDLYRAFAFACEPWRKFLVKSFGERESLTREPLYPTHALVLYHLYNRIHGPMEAGGELGTVKSLSNLINRTLALIGDPMRLNPREVGAALTTLGVTSRKRCARGWEVLITDQDKKTIHQLVEKYGIDIEAFWPSFQACRDCAFCRDRWHPIFNTGFQRPEATYPENAHSVRSAQESATLPVPAE